MADQFATMQHDPGIGGGSSDTKKELARIREEKRKREEERKRVAQQEAANKAALTAISLDQEEVPGNVPVRQTPYVPPARLPEDDEPTVPKPQNYEPTVAKPTKTPDVASPIPPTPTMWNDSLGYQDNDVDPEPWRSNWDDYLGTVTTMRDRVQRWWMEQQLPEGMQPPALPSTIPPPGASLQQNTAAVSVEDEDRDDPQRAVERFLDPFQTLGIAPSIMVPGSHIIPGLSEGFRESGSFDAVNDRRKARVDKIQNYRQSLMGFADPDKERTSPLGRTFDLFQTATESGLGRGLGVVSANALLFPFDVATEALPKYALGEMTSGQWKGLIASGEIPDILDTPYQARVGLIEPVVNGASALWRTIQPGLVGQIFHEDAPEILRLPDGQKIENGFAPVDVELPLIGEARAWGWVGKAQDMTNQARETRTFLAEMQQEDPEMAQRLSVGLTNFVSDSSSAATTIEEIYTKDARIALLEQEMFQAMQSGDTQQAQVLQYQVTQEKNKSDLDYVDANANVWAELAFGLIADPTIVVGKAFVMAGMTPELRSLQKAMKEVSPEFAEEVLKSYPAIMKGANEVLEGLAKNKFFTMGKSGLAETAERGPFNLGILARKTPEAQSLTSTFHLHTAISNLTMHLSDPADIRLVVTQLMEDPASLSKGVTGMVSPTAEMTKSNRWYPGNWAFTNQNFTDNFPVLKAAQKDILAMPEFQKTSPNKEKLMAELDGVLFQTARRVYGDVEMPIVPVGTKSYERVGDKFVFTNTAGDILSETAEFDNKEANAIEKTIDEIKTLSGQEQWGAGQFLMDVSAVSRSWLSNQYLNLRPGSWIRNALGFTANLVGDDTYSFKSINVMMEDVTRITGNISPDIRLGVATGQDYEGIMSGSRGSYLGEAAQRESFGWFGRLMDNISGLGPLGKAGGKTWTGTTEIPVGPGKSIKFGEQSGYTTAFYRPFMRSIRKEWKKVVGNQVITEAEKQGVDPVTAKRFGDLLASMWDQGRQGIRSNALEHLQDNRVPITLDPDMYGETLSPTQNKNTMDFLRDITTNVSDEDEAMRLIEEYVFDMRVGAAAPMSPFPKQAGVTLFFDRDTVGDGFELADDVKQGFNQAGLQIPQNIERQVKLDVSDGIEQLNKVLHGFQDDLADVQADGALDFTMDVMGQWGDARIAYLSDKEKIFSSAAEQGRKGGGGAAWDKAYKESLERWHLYVQQSTDIVGKARSTLLSPDGLPDSHRTTDRILERIANFDDIENELNRLKGLELERFGTDMPSYRDAVAANREMLEFGMAQMLDAYRRYPSSAGFNSLYDAMLRMDTNGVVISQYVRKFGEQLGSNQVPAAVYYRNRNDAYNQFFTQMYEYFVASGASILEQGIAAKASPNPVESMASIPDALANYFRHIENTRPAFTPMPTLAPGYVPSLGDFEEAATRLMIPVGTGAKGRKRDWRYLLAWADDNVDGFERARRNGMKNVTEEEQQLIFRKLTDKIQMGETKGGASSQGLDQVSLFGLEPDESLVDVVREQNKAMNAMAGQKAIDVADVWESTDQQYSRMAGDMAAIWRGDAGKQMSSHDAVILKDILDQTLPYYDNVVGAATSVGQRMGQFALLNFADRRNADTLAAVIFPFHYFWSRSPKNWTRRMMTRPQVANWWYDAEKAVALENKQAGTEGTRWEDSMPNPMAMFNQGAPARVGNIIKYAMPNYGANPFVNPEEANNKYEATAKSVIQYGPGIAPQADMLLAGSMDTLYPLEDGTKRMDDYNFGDYLPWMRVGYYGLSAARGEFMPTASRMFGDEWDAYRVGREIAIDVDNPDAETQATHMLAGQVLDNQQEGRDKWDGIPDNDRAWIEENLPKFIQRANWDRFTTLLSSSITGVGAYHRRPDEMQMREGKAMYAAGGWTPDQPGGSKAGRTGLLEEYPGNTVAWSLGALRPGYEGQSPAEAAEETLAWDALDKASEALSAKQSAVLAKDPLVTKEAMGEFTKEEDAALEAAFANLPEMDAKSTKGMNPQEKAEYVIEGIWKAGKKIYPTPTYPEAEEGEEVPDEAKATYFDEKGIVEEQRLAMLQSRIQAMMERESFYSEYMPPQDQAWYNELKAMLSGRTAEDWIAMYRGRYQSNEYFEWKRGHDLYQDATNRIWDEKDEYLEDVGSIRFSKPELALYEEYRQMPKKTDEQKEARKEFGLDNGVIYHIQTMHLNPEEYEEGKAMWGEDWYEKQSNIPSKQGTFGTSELAPAQQQEWYKIRDSYTAQNPEANAIRLWFQGRPKPEDMRQEIAERLGYVPNDWGDAYTEAVSIFGEEVFQMKADEAQASVNDTWFDYKDNNWDAIRKTRAYDQWFWDLNNDPSTVAEMTGFLLTSWETEALDEVIGALEAGRADQMVMVPGTAGPTPSYWRGDATPAQFVQNFGASIGAVPSDVYDPDKPFFVAGDVAPDPKEYISPDALKMTVPGMDVTTEQSLGAQSNPADVLDMEIPGMTTAVNLMLDEHKKILRADAKRPDPKTMEELLKESDTYQKLVAKKAEWANWEAKAYTRQSFAVNVFGADPQKWNAYFNLEKGSDARKAMRAADPVLDASLTFAYNQDKWPDAQDAGFTAEDVTLWARRPDWVEGSENEQRTKFFTDNPRAYLFNTWINGRYKPSDSDDPTYSRDWGQDYRGAQEQFGGDIWEKVIEYRALPKGTGERTQYRQANPNFAKWEAWWYSNSDSSQAGGYSYYPSTRYSGTRGSYSRSSGGGGVSGGGYGSWSNNHDVGFPDGGVNISPYHGTGYEETPRFHSPFSQSADNWRRYLSGNGSRLMNWNTQLGGR